MTYKLSCRPARPSHEFAATVGALPGEDALRAGHTERALERADPRFHRLRRKVPITAFATWFQVKHLAPPHSQRVRPGELSWKLIDKFLAQPPYQRDVVGLRVIRRLHHLGYTRERYLHGIEL